MNASLTYNSVVFEPGLSKALGESRRQSTARGVTTPDVLTIRNQDYVDSKSKVSGKRYNALFESYEIDANAKLVKSQASVTFSIPETADPSQVATLVATFKDAIADADFVTDLIAGEA
jgi:hypothetical protein